MPICTRTTLNLPDGLVAQAKAHAAASGQTLTSLVKEGLRLVGADELALHDTVLAGVALPVTNPRIFADPAADRDFSRFPGVRTVDPAT